MKYLRYLLILISVFGWIICYAQSLSSRGNAHLRAAEALAQSASSGEDYIQVAEEYEKIIETDPSYYTAYIEAAHAYALATPHLGKPAYNKGINILDRLKRQNPSLEDEIYSEKVVLEAMLKKHNNGPARLYGTWGEYGYNNGKFLPFIKVTENGNTPNVEFLGYYIAGSNGVIKDVRIDVSGNICNLEIDQYWDDRPSLRKEGWTHYVDDCDGYADPGYPTTGTYKYNDSFNTYYYTIDLSSYPLVAKCVKIHSDYYYNGTHTYSETDRSTSILNKKLEKK